jgi:hypothetical protein
MPSPLAAGLARALASRLAPAAATWLAEAEARIARQGLPALGLAVGAARRVCGDAPLSADLGGGLGGGWTVDQAARVHLVLHLDAGDADRWLRDLDRLFASASLEELVAYYQGLSLLPHGDHLRERAAEGIRHSAVAVFAAVAIGNPYPAAHLDDDAFNQMVLKAAFNAQPLRRIIALERRATPALASMLHGYIRERTLARREIAEDLRWAAGLHPTTNGSTS